MFPLYTMPKNSQQKICESKSLKTKLSPLKPFIFAVDIFLAIFFPIKCLGCGKYGELLCFECGRKIDKIKTSTCPECGRISELGKYCPSCRRRLKTSLDGIIITAKYDTGPIKQLIAGYKYDGITGVLPILAELINEKIPLLLSKNSLIAYVPLHPKRERERGFNQSREIAKYLAVTNDISLTDCLKKVKNTPHQVGLSRAARRKNVKNVFVCLDKGDPIKGRNIILIDDVATTGSTLQECAKELKKAGAKKVHAFVIARNR